MEWGLMLLIGLVLLYIFLEIVYYLFAKCWLAPRLGRKTEPQLAWFKNIDLLVKDVFDALKSMEGSYSFETFLKGSFCMADPLHIQGGNFDSFLCWALYTKRIAEASTEEKLNIVAHRKRIQKQFDMKWTDETTPNLRHIQFNLEDLGYIHHPLILKGLMGSFELHSDIANFYWHGFRRERTGTATYWYREVPESKKTPLVFFHGICSGWFFYAKIILALCLDRTVVLYDNKSTVLNCWCYTTPTAQEVNDNLLLILKKHHINEITVFAHSWGTYLAGWVVQMNPQIVRHLILVDPACFAASLPETAYTVFYKSSETTVDYLLAYFLRSDLTLSHTLRRNVAWYNIYFSFSYIPEHMAVTIGLSAKDILISYDALNKMTDSFLESRIKRLSDKSDNVARCRKFSWDILHAEAMTDDSCISEMKQNLADFEGSAVNAMDHTGHELDTPLINSAQM